jgi:hypothetical protein
MASKHVFDLAKLHAQTAYLHLLVNSPQILDPPVRQVTR